MVKSATAATLRATHAAEDHEDSDGACSCLYWAQQWEAAAAMYRGRPVYGSV